MSPPVVSIVGKKKSGKTTLVVKLVAELVRRGHRVATIKHDRHGFEIDHEGTDSYRHFHAGAATGAIVGPGKMAMVKRCETEPDLDDVVADHFSDVDIVITEGFKSLSYPKIETFRPETHERALCEEDEDDWVALASDVDRPASPTRYALDDVCGLADLLEERFLKSREEAR